MGSEASRPSCRGIIVFEKPGLIGLSKVLGKEIKYAGDNLDTFALTELLGHEPRTYEDFANETMREWQMLANPRAAA